MGKRTDTMSLFQEHKKALVSNARCLLEGVNIPSVDMVVFVDPKRSKTEIAQAAGRAMRVRNVPNKTIGYVLVPLFVETFRGEAVGAASARSGFEEVLSTLRGLAQFDDDLRDELTLIKVNQLRGKGLNRIGKRYKNLKNQLQEPMIHVFADSRPLELAISTKLLNQLK